MPRQNRCQERIDGENRCQYQSWDSFCVAGAVFGEVAASLFVAGAAVREILGDSRSAKCCICSYKMRLQDGTSQVSELAGAKWRFYRRISSEDPRNVVESSLYWRKQFKELTPKPWAFTFSWQAQYLVKLEGDFTCSVHCTWHFICHADQSWDSFCVAGAVFGELEGWLYLLPAL